MEHFATAHKVKVPVTVCWLVAWLLNFFQLLLFFLSLFLFFYESQSLLFATFLRFLEKKREALGYCPSFWTRVENLSKDNSEISSISRCYLNENSIVGKWYINYFFFFLNLILRIKQIDMYLILFVISRSNSRYTSNE